MSLLAKPISIFFDEEHARDAYNDEQQIIKTGQPIVDKLEKEIQKGETPEVRWALTSKFPLKEPDGSIAGTFGITRDVTGRIRAEQDLQKSEEKYRSIFENIRDVIYRTDKEGIITDISPSIENYSGYKRSEIIGQHVSRFYYFDEDRDQLLKKLKEEGMVSDFEIRLKTDDNRLVYTSVNSYLLKNDDGKVIGVEGIMRDISERKEAERKLQESADTLEKFSRQLPRALYQLKRSPNGTYTLPYSGYGIQQFFDFDQSEKGNEITSLFDFIHKDDLEHFYHSIEVSYHSLEDWELDFRVKHPSFGPIWIRGRSRPEKHDDGSVIWHGYLTDITEEKKREQELNRTMDIVSDQNKRLVNFAHIVTHNLRNHAGNFTMLLSLLSNDPTDEEKEEAARVYAAGFRKAE